MLNIANYINGQLIAPISGEYLDNMEPATGKVYSRVPDSDDRDVDAAVEAADRAFLWMVFLFFVVAPATCGTIDCASTMGTTGCAPRPVVQVKSLG